MPHFFCVKCGQKIDADPSMAGVSLPCPACKYQLSVPPLGTGATRLPPLSSPQPTPAPPHQPAATPTPAPWQSEPPQPSQRTGTRRAAGNPRQLIIGSVIAIATVIGLFAGLSAWEKSKANTGSTKATTPPPAEASPAPTPPPAETPTPTPPPAATASQQTTTPPSPAEKTAAADRWITTDFHGLQLHLPGQPIPSKQPLDEGSANRLVGGTRDYRNLEHGQADISITHSTYKPEYFRDPKAMVSEDAAVLASGTKDFTSKITGSSISGRESAQAEMAYNLVNQSFQHHTLYISQGHQVWKLSIIGPPTEVGAVWKRISDQLEFSTPAPAPAPATPADDWVASEFHGMRVTLPGKLTPFTDPPPADVLADLAGGDWHNSQLEGPGYLVDVVHTLDKSTPAVDLAQAAQDFIRLIAATPETTSFYSRQNDITVSGHKAIEITMSYYHGDVTMRHHAIVLTRGAETWCLCVLGVAGNTDEDWKRIRENIQFTPPTPPASPTPPPPAREEAHADGWITTDFEGLSLPTPKEFKRSKEPQVPAKADHFTSPDVPILFATQGKVSFRVTHQIYKPGYIEDVRTLRDDCVSLFRRISSPDTFRSKQGEVPRLGHNAAFAEISGTKGNPDDHYKFLFLSQGPVIWRITVIGPGSEIGPVWNRLFDHVKIPGGPAEQTPPPTPAPKTVTDRWTTTDFHGLLLNLPGNLTPSAEPIPPDIASMVVGGKWDHSLLRKPQYTIEIIHSVEKNDVDAKLMAEAAVLAASKTKDITNLRSSTGKTTISGREAAYADMSYDSDGVPTKHYNLVVAIGREVWDLTVIGDSAPTAEAWKRIRPDIRFASADPSTASSGDSSAKPAADGWITADFHGLALELPATPQPSPMAAPPGVAEMLVGGKWDQSFFRQNGFEFNIVHATYKKEHVPDLRLMSEEAFKGVSEIPTVTRALHHLRETTVSGRKAVRGELTYQASGKPQLQNSLVISQGQEVWFITTLGTPEKATATAKRVFDSATFGKKPTAPAPPTAPATAWIDTTFHGLNLRLPAKPKPSGDPASPELAAALVDGKWTEATVAMGDYDIKLIHANYKKKHIPSMKSLVDAAIAGVSESPHVAQLKTTRKETNVLGRDFAVIEMSYLAGGLPCQQNLFIILYEGENWFIEVGGKAEAVPAPWKAVRENLTFQ